jgi:RNA polymerase sigma factor (TIGR02999 family)
MIYGSFKWVFRIREIITMKKKQITELLKAHSSGNQQALDDLMPLVYDEIRDMAHFRLMSEKADHTLNTTDLVHEAYLKLVEFNRIEWENRAHFFAIASQVLRNILVDYAVKKKAQKRGGDRQRVTLGDPKKPSETDLHDMLSIHQALNRLAEVDERQVRVVECRFFGGLTVEETAKALGISTPTVSRDWKMARAWLNRELSEE